MTQIVLGDGSDVLNVAALPGETNVLGGRGADIVNVTNSSLTVDEITSNLHFDGSGTIVEQTAGIVYHGATHDNILAAVPYVYTETAGGTPSAPALQYKEPILTASRTSHVSVFGTPIVGSLSEGVRKLSRNIATYWSSSNLLLQGVVATGGVWTLRINDEEYSHTVTEGQQLDDIAAALVGLATSSAYPVSHTPGSSTINVGSGATPFTVQLINGLNNVAAITVSSQRISSNSNCLAKC